MSTDQTGRNKATITRFDAAVNSGDLKVISNMIDELIAPDAQMHTPGPLEGTARQVQKQIWAMLLHAYPDIHVTVEDVLADGDKVVIRNTVTGTHQGEYMGIAPTGKSVTYNEIFIFRLEDGQMAEIWGVVDLFSMTRQLGGIPG